MQRRLKILTFNHHESYLGSLAATGHQFEVVERVGDLNLGWNLSARPRPNNLIPVQFDGDIKAKLRSGYYDVVIAHTIRNLVWLMPYRKACFIFIAHIPLFYLSPLMCVKSFAKKLLLKFFRMFHRTLFFAVSEFKRASWNIDGYVGVLTPQSIPELEPGQGYDRILIVCNQLLKRKEELGYTLIEDLAQSLPLFVLGNNPGVSYAIKPKDFHQFQDELRKFRIYLYTIQQPWGDGYNTAMLEAMAMGMAVVSIDNPTTPIVHNHNGLVGKDVGELKQHLQTLLNSPSLVDRLGVQARNTIAQHFGHEQFIATWQKVLKAAAPEDVN